MTLRRRCSTFQGLLVVSCAVAPLGSRRVLVMQGAAEHACPRCRVLVGASRRTAASRGSRTCPSGTAR